MPSKSLCILAQILVPLTLTVLPLRAAPDESRGNEAQVLRDELRHRKLSLSVFERLLQTEKWHMKKLAQLKEVSHRRLQEEAFRLDALEATIQCVAAEVRVAEWAVRNGDEQFARRTLMGILEGLRFLSERISGTYIPLVPNEPKHAAGQAAGITSALSLRAP